MIDLCGAHNVSHLLSVQMNLYMLKAFQIMSEKVECDSTACNCRRSGLFLNCCAINKNGQFGRTKKRATLVIKQKVTLQDCMHCPEATSYLDMNVSNTHINYAIYTEILLLHMSSDCVLPLNSRSQCLERSIHSDACPRDRRAQSRRLQPTRRVGTKWGAKLTETAISPLPYPYGCLGLLWLGYVVVRKGRDHTPSLVRAVKNLCDLLAIDEGQPKPIHLYLGLLASTQVGLLLRSAAKP